MEYKRTVEMNGLASRCLESWLDEQSAVLERQALEVQILYEDLETGVRAKQFCDRFEGQFQGAIVFNMQWCRFDLVQYFAFLKETANAAMRADIVLLSAQGRRELPQAVRGYVNRYLKGNAHAPPAVVVLLNRGSATSTVGRQILANLAEDAHAVGAEFFAEIESESEALAEDLSLERLRSRAETVTGLLMEQMSRTDFYSRRHWGINE